MCVCLSVCLQFCARGLVCKCICLQVGLCAQNSLCLCMCICLWPGLGAGAGFSAGVGGQEVGGTLLRKSTHKDLAGRAFLPAPLPRLKPQQLGPSS